MKTDFLVIGSGAAGLSFALKAAEHGHVTLVTKGKMDECNTNYAQGGICSVTYAPDTFEKHIHDTLVCGAGKCDPAAVELVVRRAPELIRDLIAWGTKFDKTPDGRFELNREGGHTEHRILHHEDLTGAEIERALITSVRKHPNITVLEHHFAIDLLTQHHLGEFVTRHTRGLACFGAYVLNLESNEIETVLAKFTVVAAGGCGNVYSSTTNPSVATGDGIAMCHRAKAITENMEFIQFHPTSLYHPAEKPNFLITEAMRGYGAILRLQNGEEFMDKYHPMKSLAPRDVTARAIYTEMTRRGEDFVYLDVRHKDPEQTRRHFPNIYEKCLSLGIDITRDLIPVTPAAHYCCGGVKVDLNGETSIRRLYALGETPLPHSIINRPVEPDDAERFQSIFARNEGAVTAPTASLHFSRELMKRMEIKGIDFAYITLHAGLGNFRDIDVEDLTKHKTDSEQMIVNEEAVRIVNHAKDLNRQVCAVGTTVMRAIESTVSTDGHLKEYEGWTNKFIFPPYDFTVANAMISNFHMPLSTLLMIVAAFGGYEQVMEAYNVALKEEYRFGTYGDAMLITDR